MQNFNSFIEEEKSNLSSSEDEPEQIELFSSEEECKSKNCLERSRSFDQNWEEKKSKHSVQLRYSEVRVMHLLLLKYMLKRKFLPQGPKGMTDL